MIISEVASLASTFTYTNHGSRQTSHMTGAVAGAGPEAAPEGVTVKARESTRLSAVALNTKVVSSMERKPEYRAT